MDQIALPFQQAVYRIRQVAPDLAHPQPIRVRSDAGDLDSSGRKLDEEQNDEPLQAGPCPGFYCKEVRCYDQVPVLSQKLLPTRLAASFRCRFNAVLSKDVRNSAASNLMPKVGARSLNPVGSPRSCSLRPTGPLTSRSPRPFAVALARASRFRRTSVR